VAVAVTGYADESASMVTVDGNHNSVSAMRSAVVSDIHTR
jgi:hypothetical protein